MGENGLIIDEEKQAPDFKFPCIGVYILLGRGQYGHAVRVLRSSCLSLNWWGFCQLSRYQLFLKISYSRLEFPSVACFVYSDFTFTLFGCFVQQWVLVNTLKSNFFPNVFEMRLLYICLARSNVGVVTLSWFLRMFITVILPLLNLLFLGCIFQCHKLDILVQLCIFPFSSLTGIFLGLLLVTIFNSFYTTLHYRIVCIVHSASRFLFW